MIWAQDNRLLGAALDFYAELCDRLPEDDWVAVQSLLASDEAPSDVDLGVAQWTAVRAAHRWA